MIVQLSHDDFTVLDLGTEHDAPPAESNGVASIPEQSCSSIEEGQHSSFRVSKNAMLLKSIADLRKERDALKDTVTSLTERNRKLEEEVDTLHTVADDLLVQNNELKAEADRLRKERNRLCSSTRRRDSFSVAASCLSDSVSEMSIGRGIDEDSVDIFSPEHESSCFDLSSHATFKKKYKLCTPSKDAFRPFPITTVATARRMSAPDTATYHKFKSCHNTPHLGAASRKLCRSVSSPICEDETAYSSESPMDVTKFPQGENFVLRDLDERNNECFDQSKTDARDLKNKLSKILSRADSVQSESNVSIWEDSSRSGREFSLPPDDMSTMSCVWSKGREWNTGGSTRLDSDSSCLSVATTAATCDKKEEAKSAAVTIVSVEWETAKLASKNDSDAITVATTAATCYAPEEEKDIKDLKDLTVTIVPR